jgi:hypothetical protein
MKLTSRGKRVAAALVLLLGAGLLFLDPFLLGAFVVAGAFFAYEAFDAYSILKRADAVSLDSNSFEGRVLRGNSRRFSSTLRCDRSVTFDLSSLKWIRLDATSFAPGDWPVGIELTSDLAGSYSTHVIPADVSSRYGLLSTRIVIPLNATLRVYPRMVAAALAALEFLTRVGAGTEGEVEKSLLGPGLEYAETKEYLPGDNLRRVDWKATARSSSLMIKHYYVEGGGALHIIYFVEAPGPRTHDEMATQLIDLVVSSAVRATPISVTAYEKGRRLASFTGRGWEVVISTLNLVMAEAGVDYDDLYSLLDVVSVSKERRALILAGRARLAELRRRVGGKRQALVADFRGVVAQLSSPDVMSSFIILSSLVSNRDALAEIIEDLRFRKAETTVVYPKKPWLDAANLTEAYTLEASQEKMLSFVESTGSLVGAIPLKLPRMTGVPSWAVSAAA